MRDLEKSDVDDYIIDTSKTPFGAQRGRLAADFTTLDNEGGNTCEIPDLELRDAQLLVTPDWLTR